MSDVTRESAAKIITFLDYNILFQGLGPELAGGGWNRGPCQQGTRSPSCSPRLPAAPADRGALRAGAGRTKASVVWRRCSRRRRREEGGGVRGV